MEQQSGCNTDDKHIPVFSSGAAPGLWELIIYRWQGGFKTQMQLSLALELPASPTLAIYNSFSMAGPFVAQGSQGHQPEESSTQTLLAGPKGTLC